MLVRITDCCTMGCSHCFIADSGPEGGHMTWATFEKTLIFGLQLGSHVVILSGGEPTEHPDFVSMVQRAREIFPIVTLVSNGLFLLDDAKYQAMVRLTQEQNGGRFFVQITNDSRFYPHDLSTVRPKAEQHRWAWEDRITQIVACPRTKGAGIQSTRRSPSCFNVRANARRIGLREAVTTLECVYQLVCTPSVNIDGSVRAGEMDTCYKIGTVFDPISVVESKIKTMTCHVCGLLAGLTPSEQDMIDESL